VAPPDFDEGLACHDDLNLDNVIFRDGRAVALIDFDWASPGSAVWDVAGAVRLWAPLRPEHYIDDARRGRGLDRLRTFVAAYGAELDPERLVEAVRLNHVRMYRLIEEGGQAGNLSFAAYWQESADRVAATTQWYTDHAERLVQALR
jgi:Ser/Thr protein kinase RdoA (MazF antagonist)